MSGWKHKAIREKLIAVSTARSGRKSYYDNNKEFPPHGGTTLDIDGVIRQLENPPTRQ